VLDLAGRGHARPYVRFASSATNSLHASKTSFVPDSDIHPIHKVNQGTG
jgi:hypothetical protein